MTTVDNWPVEISLHAEEGKTQAVVRLAKDGVSMTGHGLACRNPDDQEVTQIGGDRGRAGPVRPRSSAAQRCGRADRGHHAPARPPVPVSADRSTGRGCAGVGVPCWRLRTRLAADLPGPPGPRGRTQRRDD